MKQQFAKKEPEILALDKLFKNISKNFNKIDRQLNIIDNPIYKKYIAINNELKKISNSITENSPLIELEKSANRLKTLNGITKHSLSIDIEKSAGKIANNILKNC